VRLYLRGYRAEEWSEIQLAKCFKLPSRKDFIFKLIECPPRRLETFAGTTLPCYLMDASKPAPDHKDKLTTLAGAFKRLAAEVSSLSFKKSKRIVRYARKYIYPQFQSFTPQEVPSTLDWINNINHPEKRKQELREAFQKVSEEGLFGDPTSDHSDPRDASSFIKDEYYDEEKPSRWINSSADVIKAVFGPVADRAMESLVAHPSMIKTVPVAERARAIRDDLGDSTVIAQSSDATAMEDHYANIPDANNDPRYRISNDFMLYLIGDHEVTRRHIEAVRFAFYRTPGLPTDPALRNRLFSTIEDSTTLRGFLSNILDTYRRLKMREFGYVLVNAILCSGEMNTSFKNTSSMYIMANYASYDLSHGGHPHCRCKNEGDDSLGVYHPGCEPDERWWSDHGWVVKVEFSGPVPEASFCGLVFDDHDLVSVPDIRGTLAKFGWTGRKYLRASSPLLKGLLRSKALSMACEYKDVPILGPLAHQLLKLTSRVHVRQSIIDQMNQYERDRYLNSTKSVRWKEKPDIGFRTRLLVARLQNIPVGLQISIEESFPTILSSLQPFSLPELDFNPVWIHNMTRCSDTLDVLRQVDMNGRRRVVSYMNKAVKTLKWNSQKPRMKRQLKLLESHRI